MKKITSSVIGAMALLACGSEGNVDTVVSLNNNIDSVSYAVGVNSANGLKQQFSEGNMDAFLKGFQDVLDSADLMMATEDGQAVIQAYTQKKQMDQMAEKAKQDEMMYGGLKEEGEKFLEANKANEGVQVTPSGLQYMVMKKGSGKQPVATSNVTVHYTGMLTDGTVFESSVQSGSPATFGLNQVIPGWTEGVQLMKEGAKYKFFIPQELGYGANVRPDGPIKPYMALIFEIELIKVND